MRIGEMRVTSRFFREVYYGWVIVGISFISLIFWFGVRTSFSVFYVAILEDFSWTHGATAGIQSMALITSAVVAPIIGGLIDRLGPRRVIGPGIFLMALGLILCSSVKTIAQIYVFYGVIMSAGVSCIGIVAYLAILAHWFDKRRGLASGIAVSGMGLGTFVLVPGCQYLISLLGWQLTFIVLGFAGAVFLLPLNMIFLRYKPDELGLYSNGPDGSKKIDNQGQKENNGDYLDREWTLRKALKTVKFWANGDFYYTCTQCQIFRRQGH